MGLQAVSDSLQLLLIFQINVRPQNILCSLTIEVPVALGAIHVLELNGLESVFDLGCEQVSVLIADIGRRSFEMDVHPTVALETISRFQPRLIGVVRIRLGEAKSRADEQHTDDKPEPNQ